MLNSIKSTSALFGNVRLRSGRNNLDASRTFQMHRECLRHAQWPVYHDVAWAGLLSKDAVHFAFVRVTSRSLVDSSIDHCRDPIRVPAPRICAVLIGFALIEVSDSALSTPAIRLEFRHCRFYHGRDPDRVPPSSAFPVRICDRRFWHGYPVRVPLSWIVGVSG